MISIDGMRPDYVTQADQHDLKLPTLRSFLREGTYADGVVGVFPTVTYPSHTTLMTGVWPAEHGIANNQRFDPEKTMADAWYWYADAIKVPTVWGVAHATGLTRNSIHQPQVVGVVLLTELAAPVLPNQNIDVLRIHRHRPAIASRLQRMRWRYLRRGLEGRT